MQEEEKYEDNSGRPFWYICGGIVLLVVLSLALAGCEVRVSIGKQDKAKECVQGYMSGDAFFPELDKDGKPVPCKI